MKLTLKRFAMKDTYTIGRLYVNGKYFCDTLEDKVRDLNRNGTFDNGEVKVNGETAIPFGTYGITLSVQSPRFSKSAQYEKIKGYLPRLIGVKHFDGVLIHIGNTAADSAGCILVGENKVKGKVINSSATFWKLYGVLREAYNKGEGILIEVK